MNRTMLVPKVILVAAVFFCTIVAGEPGSKKQPVAFVNVSVVPMDSERIIANQTVLIQNGRIRAIGPADAMPIPEAAVRIEGTGTYLMPGLADMHAHLAHDEDADPDALVVFLAAGVTTLRNMWGQPIHLEWRKRISDGDLLGPNIYSVGPITDGDPPFWYGSSVVRTPDEAAKEVADQKRAGYDEMKVFTNLSPDVYKAILDAARAHDFPIYGHVPTRIGLKRALTSGQKSFEHLIDFTYALLPDDSPVRVQLVDMWGDSSKRNWRGMFLDPYEQADRSKIPDLAATAADAGVWICPTPRVRTSRLKRARTNLTLNEVAIVQRPVDDLIESRRAAQRFTHNTWRGGRRWKRSSAIASQERNSTFRLRIKP